MKLHILIAAFLASAIVCFAQSPASSDQLARRIAELQQSPNDSALREKIIELVGRMNPKPALPEEARRHGIIATTLEKDAKDPADYDLVLKEYDAALAAAPWWPEALISKSKAAEARGKYELAMDTLKLYLLTQPSGSDARTAQDKIYALEAKQVKAQNGKTEQQRHDAQQRAEKQYREQEAATQRQEEPNTTKGQKLAGEWRGEGFDYFLTIAKTGDGYRGSIPNDGKWVQGTLAANGKSYQSNRSLKEFWISGNTVHFSVELWTKIEGNNYGPANSSYTLTLSPEGDKLEGKSDAGKVETFYRRD